MTNGLIFAIETFDHHSKADRYNLSLSSPQEHVTLPKQATTTCLACSLFRVMTSFLPLSGLLVVAVTTLSETLSEFLSDGLTGVLRCIVGQEEPAASGASALFDDNPLVDVNPDYLVAGFEVVLLTELLRDGRPSLLRDAS